MKEEVLKKLLEKYYDGTANPDEEQLLRDYFAAGSPEGYEAEKEIFSYYTSHAPVPDPSEGFELRIMERIGSSEAKRGNLRKILIPLAGLAATVAIVAVTVLFADNRANDFDTYSDPALAYAETMKILYSVSVQMNKGADALEPFSKISRITEKSIGEIDESSGKIRKNLRILSKEFGKADTTVDK